ncbi:MAG: prepilin-type N-terminal cleavage/methylation domain-containing protein [Acidobacteriota bacterium]
MMVKPKHERGFSLIELLLVVTIMGVLAAIAVPALRRSRHLAQGASAIQTLKVFGSGQILYERKYAGYGTLAQLYSENIIDPIVATGTKSEYNFTLTVGPTGKTFTINANPQSFSAEGDFYFMDETGVIRSNRGAPANASSPPIPR